MSKFWFKRMGQDVRGENSGGLSAFSDGENGALDFDLIEAFELWRRNHKDPRGNRKFTYAMIRKRVGVFQGCRKIFRNAKISNIPLELIDDPDVLHELD